MRSPALRQTHRIPDNSRPSSMITAVASFNNHGWNAARSGFAPERYRGGVPTDTSPLCPLYPILGERWSGRTWMRLEHGANSI